MEILCKGTVTNMFEVGAYRMHEFVNPLKDKEEEISGGPTFPGCVRSILCWRWAGGEVNWRGSGSGGYVAEQRSQFYVMWVASDLIR